MLFKYPIMLINLFDTSDVKCKSSFYKSTTGEKRTIEIEVGVVKFKFYFIPIDLKFLYEFSRVTLYY